MGTDNATLQAPDRVRIVRVTKYFSDVRAVHQVSLNVHQGEVVLIIGPSGSGKSTLLRCVNRLEKASSGEIWIDGDQVTDPHVDIRKIREEVGMVFQTFNLFPHLTALQNITLAPASCSRPTRATPTVSASGCWSGWAWRTSGTATPTSSPAASSSGWPSPAPWP